MKYLTVMSDYTGSCLYDDFIGQIEFDELGLPQEYISMLYSWNESYRRIIPLSENERFELNEEIEQLDREGIELARKLIYLVPGGAKVKYYSEVKLKHLHL